MRFFRSHRLEMASLALFALACQFVLAFAHVHPGTGNRAVVAVGLAVASSDVPTSPRQKDPSRLGDDFCAICASIGLSGALVVPAAPAVTPEIASFKELRWSFAATQAVPIGRFHFSARGPPRA
jgi:hypothetical protein